MLGYFEGLEKPSAAESETWVLVVHYDFKNWRHHIREGNERDVENIKSTFSARGCKVRDLASVKKEEVLETLRVKKRLKGLFGTRTTPAVFILFILSHGLEDGFIQTDYKLTSGVFDSFNTSEIWKNTKENALLKQTLKVFFLGPCRGGKEEQRVLSSANPVSNTNDKPCTYLVQANCQNLICFYATVETTMAARDFEKGTLLVRAVCKELRHMREDFPLEVFLTKLQYSIREMRSFDGTAQTPEIRYFPFRKYFIKKPDGIISLSPYDAIVVSKPLDETRRSFFQWKREGDNYFFGRKALLFSESSHELVCKFKEELFKFDFTATIHPLNDAVLSITEKVCTLSEEDGCLLICVFGELSLLQPDANNHQEVCMKIGNEIVPIRLIIGQFTGERCPQLVAKPKVFFFFDMGTRLETSGPTIRKTPLCSTNHSSSIVLIAQGKDAVKGLIDHFGTGIKNGGNLLKVLIEAIRKIDAIYKQQNLDYILPQVNSTLHQLLDFPCDEKTTIEHTFRENYQKIAFSEVKKKVVDALSSSFKNHKDFKTTVVSSAAGMGKSISTEQLAKHLKNNTSEFLIVHVALSNYEYFLYGKSVSIMQFLEKNLSKHKPELREFRRQFPKKRIMLLLDGFDEICPRYRFTALSLFKDAADLNLPMWITTRPQEEKEITKVLKDVKFNRLEIDELSTENKIKVLQQRLNWSLTKCETLLKDLESKKCSELSSNILHLSMICDIILSGSEVISLFQTYDFVFQQKLRMSLLKEGAVFNEKSFEKVVERKILHYKAAMMTFSGKNHSEHLTTKEVTDINSTGLITITEQSANYEHKTFYEFLLCRIFLEQHGIRHEVGLEQTAEDLMKLEHLSYARKYFDDYFGHKYLAKDLQSSEDILKELRDTVAIKTVLESICKYGLLGIYISYFCRPSRSDFLRLEKEVMAKNPHLLYLACCSNEELALKMISRGAEVKSLDSLSWIMTKRSKLIQKIAENNSVRLLKKLVSQCPEMFKDCKREIISFNGTTALHEAVSKDYVDIAKILVQKFDYEIVQDTILLSLSPISLAAQVGSKDCAGFLQKECTRQSLKQKVPPILYAAYAGHVEVVKTLIANGADMNPIPKSNIRLIKWFTSVMHRWNKQVLNFLGTKVKEKVEKFLWWLDKHQFQIDFFSLGRNALHVAAAKGHTDVARTLVETGIDVNAKDDDGCTPLELSVQNKHEACTKYLFEVCDVNARNDEEQTPLHFASRNGDLNLVKKCIERGAKIEAVDDLGYTAFHYAAREGHLACVQYFSENFPQVLNHTSFCGNTALHCAVGEKHEEIVEFFREQGRAVQDTYNRSPFERNFAANRFFSKSLATAHVVLFVACVVFFYIDESISYNDKLLINSYTYKLKYPFLFIEISLVLMVSYRLRKIRLIIESEIRKVSANVNEFKNPSNYYTRYAVGQFIFLWILEALRCIHLQTRPLSCCEHLILSDATFCLAVIFILTEPFFKLRAEYSDDFVRNLGLVHVKQIIVIYQLLFVTFIVAIICAVQESIFKFMLQLIKSEFFIL